MAGHSHSANVAIRKGAQDKKRGKLFTKLSKEIIVAAKMGGADMDSNPRLRLAVRLAKQNSVPKDTIARAISRGSGNLEGDVYEEITMEGYGAGGVAVLAEVLTDNRNRAASDIRHAFAKGGGKQGVDGCVSYLFKRRGILMVDSSDEDGVMMAVIDAGVEDLTVEEDGIEIVTAPEDFEAVSNALEDNELATTSSDILLIPDNRVAISGEDAKKLLRLLDLLDDCDDVQKVHHNAEFDTAELEELLNE
jgi:YebC/PmpR family DNA-binding regulatory protein